jgi:mRNA interferase YafQ
MLKATYSKQFDRDVKKAVKRGKDIDKLKKVIGLLVREETLEERYKKSPS